MPAERSKVHVIPSLSEEIDEPLQGRGIVHDEVSWYIGEIAR